LHLYSHHSRIRRYHNPPPPLFFFNDTPTPEIYTLSLHDALPIWRPGTTLPTPRNRRRPSCSNSGFPPKKSPRSSKSSEPINPQPDRKSTRLNSSHVAISYAVFCLKKKKRGRSRSRCPIRRVTSRS